MTELRERWERAEWGLWQIGIYMTNEDRTKGFEKEAVGYCSNVSRRCSACSLTNYGMDCHNNLIGRSELRENGNDNT
jgi:hypothetical protein